MVWLGMRPAPTDDAVGTSKVVRLPDWAAADSSRLGKFQVILVITSTRRQKDSFP